MSYVFTFLAGILFCIAIVLNMFGHADQGVKFFLATLGNLFLAYLWVKWPPFK